MRVRAMVVFRGASLNSRRGRAKSNRSRVVIFGIGLGFGCSRSGRCRVGNSFRYHPLMVPSEAGGHIESVQVLGRQTGGASPNIHARKKFVEKKTLEQKLFGT